MAPGFKHILLLGKSDKFVGIIRSIFCDAQITVIPWRECRNDIHRHLSDDQAPELIVICGYDYASNHYSYDRYFDVNVTQPLSVIQALSKDSTKIVYIDTEHGTTLATFSRYRYAKNELGNALQAAYKNLCIVGIPTVVDDNGAADIHGGVFTKILFHGFMKFGLLKTVSLSDLRQRLLTALSSECDSYSVKLRPRFLIIRRTLFIDRLLRMIGG